MKMLRVQKSLLFKFSQIQVLQYTKTQDAVYKVNSNTICSVYKLSFILVQLRL